MGYRSVLYDFVHRDGDFGGAIGVGESTIIEFLAGPFEFPSSGSWPGALPAPQSAITLNGVQARVQVRAILENIDANDAIGNTINWAFANAVRVAGGSGVILSAIVATDEAANVASLELDLYSDSITDIADKRRGDQALR